MSDEDKNLFFFGGIAVIAALFVFSLWKYCL